MDIARLYEAESLIIPLFWGRILWKKGRFSKKLFYFGGTRMKHQRQGYHECYLTCIAMLTDTPLARLKESMGIYNAWDTYGLDKWNQVSSLIGIDYQGELRPAFNSQDTNPGANQEVALYDFTGKGLLILDVGKKYKVVATHAMAYENGLIYDPDYTEAETWEAFHRRRPDNTILTNTKVTIPGKTD